jgi:YfiH family protein
LENIEENRRRFFEALNLSAIPTVPLRQMHGDTVHFIERLPAATLMGDGVFTDREGLVLGVATSDCVPILLAHRDGHFVSAVHAGWRGTAARIAEKAVKDACAHYGTKAGDIFAGLGPCIHKCCYPVRSDVREAFQGAGLPLSVFEEDGNPDETPPPASDAKTSSWRLDLVEANVLQLLAAGLPPRNIEVVDRCTSCDASFFFSFRRDGEYAGRMMSVIVKGEG